MLQKKMMNMSFPGWKFLVIIGLVLGLVMAGYGNPTGEADSPKKDCETKKDGVIIFDAFEGLCENNIYKVNKDHSVEMKVTNVNPFLYRVTISGTQFDYFPDIPAALQLEVAAKPTETDSAAMSSLKDNKQKDAYGKFIAAYNKLLEIPIFQTALRSVLLKNKPYSQLETEVKQLMGRIKDFNIPSPQYIDVIYHFSELLENAREAYNALDKEEFLTSLGNLNDDEKEKWKKVMEDFEKKLQLYKKEIDSLEEKDVIGTIAGLFTKFQEANFNRSRVFPSVDADAVKITVEIEPINDKVPALAPKATLSGPIIVKVIGGVAINFSTGMFSIFSQRGFYLKDMEDDPGKVELLKDKGISFNPTIIGLLHVYRRTTRDVIFPVLTFGIGTKDAERISYFLGTSLILGTKRRFIINFGGILTKLNVLKPEYKVNDTLTKSDDLKIENLLTEQFRFKITLGISYNLSPQPQE